MPFLSPNKQRQVVQVAVLPTYLVSTKTVTVAIRLRYDYDKTTIRRIRRYHDAFDYDGSDQNYDSTTTNRARLLPFDAIRREQKTCQFFVVVVT